MERTAGSNILRAVRIAVLLVVTPILLGAICAGWEDDGVDLPDLEAFTAEQQELLHEIRDQAAFVRGLDVNDATVEGMLTREQYGVFVEEELLELDDDDLKELAVYKHIVTNLGDEFVAA